jgi:hypothetical protein
MQNEIKTKQNGNHGALARSANLAHSHVKSALATD